MPIPPQPRTFRCQACNWQGTTIPLSDCLMIGIDCHSTWPKCHSDALDSRTATRSEIMKKRLSDFLRTRHA